MNSRQARRRQRASALVETLLAAPIVLLLGLGALQWALLFHARTALEYALFEAARAGSVTQARPADIEAGLARGLVPFWRGIDTPSALPTALVDARSRLHGGLAAGWIEWRQLSPTVESFDDWSEPARDAAGYPTPGVVEIPNDSLQWPWLRAPASGAVGMRGLEPIGTQSQQTLNDANLLKLELRYGVPMSVPLVGRVAVWIMRIVDGCEPPSRLRLALVDLGMPEPSSAPRAWACPIYLAPDESGHAVPRWPVRASATIRMQSPARRSAMTPRRTQSAVWGGAGGSGGSGASGGAGGSGGIGGAGTSPIPSPSQAAQPHDGNGGSDDGSGVRDDGNGVRDEDGWLNIGADRTFSVPGACT